tara:strand:+ start:246 stop:485 length:240 start_codon:yes stop_codon:yes gene_type:complete
MVWQRILLNPKTAGKVLKKIFKGGEQKTTGREVITKLKPNVPETNLEKASRDLKLAKHKYKGSTKKVEMTVDKINEQTK